MYYVYFVKKKYYSNCFTRDGGDTGFNKTQTSTTELLQQASSSPDYNL